MHTIREYTKDDLSALHDVIRELHKFGMYIDQERLEGLEEAEDYLSYLLQKTGETKGKLYVVEMSEQIVGMVAVFIESDQKKHLVDSKKYALITDLFILPEHRNDGVVKQLLQRSEEFARSQEVDRILIRVYAHHEELMNAYHNNSYRDYERILTKKVS